LGQVEARLQQHRDLGPPDRVYVQTLDGAVYLSGDVLTAMQRDTAETVARSTTGVTRIVDNLFVVADAGR
jgi:osmotically-inducible protein OsmY